MNFVAAPWAFSWGLCSIPPFDVFRRHLSAVPIRSIGRDQPNQQHWLSSPLFGDPDQERKRFGHRPFAHPATADISEQAPPPQHRSTAAYCHEVNEAHRLFVRAAARTVKARD